MSKSILIIDTPRQCYQCPCYTCDSVSSFCQKENRETRGNTKPDWCPLKPLPEKIQENYILFGDEIVWEKAVGYNNCIDEIIGEK